MFACMTKRFTVIIKEMKMKKIVVLLVTLFVTFVIFAQASKSAQDQQACEYARRNNSAEIWEDYLLQFPQGMCAFEAKSEIKKLDKKILKSNKVNPKVSADGGHMVVMGALDRSVIDEYVRKNLAKIIDCYAEELNNAPKLSGRIVINFIISATGNVSSSKVQRTTVGNATVESCVADQIKQIVFPEPRGGGIVIVNYPFSFNSDN